MNIYRRQWDAIGVPFQTISVGLDAPFGIRNEQLAAGFIMVNEKSGDAKLNVNKLYGSLSYHKSLGIHNFHLGLQAGFVMKNYMMSQLTFPNQYNYESGLYDSSLPNNESGLGDKLSYVDMNAGIGWSAELNTLHPYAGIGFFHMNSPKESFNLTDNKLPMRLVFNVGARYVISGKYYLNPNIMYMNHAGASDLLMGGHVGYIVDSEIIKAIYLGPYFRGNIVDNTDAAVIVAGAKFKTVDFSVSYDVNVSNLTQITNYHGAFEISLIYTSASTKVYKTSIPCERF